MNTTQDLIVACPSCAAPIATPCRTAGGGRTSPHADRPRAAARERHHLAAEHRREVAEAEHEVAAHVAELEAARQAETVDRRARQGITITVSVPAPNPCLFVLNGTGSQVVLHRTDGDVTLPTFCHTALSAPRLIGDDEPIAQYRLCRKCVRQAARLDVAGTRGELLTDTHVTSVPFGALRIDRVDRTDAIALSNRGGKAGLRSYLRAWGIDPRAIEQLETVMSPRARR